MTDLVSKKGTFIPSYKCPQQVQVYFPLALSYIAVSEIADITENQLKFFYYFSPRAMEVIDLFFNFKSYLSLMVGRPSSRQYDIGK